VSVLITFLVAIWRRIARWGGGTQVVPDNPVDYLVRAPDRPSGCGARADAIPTAHTPPGGYKRFPPRILAGCAEPPAAGAPDLRGVWRVYRGLLAGHVERVEQCGDRVVITGGGVVHDMVADGVLAHGVHDVSAATGRPIEVAAEFRDGRLDLRPNGGRAVAVSRWRDGDDMVWRVGPFVQRLRRMDGPQDARGVASPG